MGNSRICSFGHTTLQFRTCDLRILDKVAGESKPKQLRHLAAADNHLMRSLQFFKKVEPALARAGVETYIFMPRLSDVESIIYGQLVEAILGTTSPGIDPSAPAKAQARISSWVKVFPQEKLPDPNQARQINASLRE